MSWLRLDDNFTENSKVSRLKPEAFMLHVSALCYAVRLATDGTITDNSLVIFAGRWQRRKQLALVTELIRAGLWELGDEPGSYLIHDFLEYNPSRAERERLSLVRARAGAKGGRPARQPILSPVEDWRPEREA